MSTPDLCTYQDLYTFVQDNSEQTIFKWLSNPWKGKDKQEVLFRLFVYLNLIEEFKEYTVCDGNYNLGTIAPNKNKSLLFNKSLKDKGDKSDLTAIKNNTIIATSSKNLKTYGLNDLDIDNIQNIHKKKYPNHNLRLCLVVPDKKQLDKLVSQAEKSSQRLREAIKDSSTLIYDWGDLNKWYIQCRQVYSNKSITELLAINKVPLVLRFHQKIAIQKLLEACKKFRDVLLCLIQRSGKTFIMGAFIVLNAEEKQKCNYLIITTAPNETIRSYLDMFATFLQFEQFNVLYLNADSTKKQPILKDKNIIVCSKHYLQSKCVKNTIKWLADLNIELCFVDESHNGGSTPLSKQILEKYSSTAKNRIHITATFNKPVHTFGITKEAWVTWDLQDIQLAKRIDEEGVLKKLTKKYGDIVTKLLQEYTLDEIKRMYSIYPDLHLLTLNFKEQVKNDLIKFFINRPEGFSMESILLLQVDANNNPIPKFQDEQVVIKLLQCIFGSSSNKNYFKVQSPGLIDNAKSIAAKNGSRWFSKEEPLTILAFLPCGIQGLPIEMLHEALEELIITKNILPNFNVVSINSKITTRSPLDVINDARAATKLQGKEGLIILSGRMLSLGVSLPHCDIVLMLNNSDGVDTFFQMIFRCMTEAIGKKCAFVIDLNLQRSINVLLEYAIKLYPKQSIKNGIKRVLLQRLIQFHTNEWLSDENGVFEETKLDIDSIVEKVYKIYSVNVDSYINNVLKNLTFSLDIDKTDQEQINTIFKNASSTKNKNSQKVEELSKEKIVSKGIISETSNVIESPDATTTEKNINIINDILRHLLPLMLILSIHSPNFTCFMELCQWLNSTITEKEILLNQLKIWWGNTMDSHNALIVISDIYKKYLADNDEFNAIFARLSEMFTLAKNKPRELSKLIDKYLIPQELEKKQNAEISTPFKLRQEMLDCLPATFWKKPRRIFEPCAGKGGFLLDIVDKFMTGLDEIPLQERYKIIVEDCLYWADINPTNVWICKLLLDPTNQYHLNYYEGNTLELNSDDYFNVVEFDAIVCNPPYEDNNNGRRKALNHNLWSDFLNWSYQTLRKNGYLLYITPNSWMSPTSKNKEIFYQNHIMYLNINECKRHFNVGSTFSYYLIKKTSKIGSTTVKCEYNKKVYTTTCNLSGMQYLPNFTTSETINIIKKFIHNDLPKISFKTSSELHNTTHSTKLSDTKNKTFKYPVRHTTTRNIRYSSVKHSLQDTSKILMNLSGHLNPIYDKGTMGFTQAQMYFLTNKKEYLSILNSKLYQFVFTICKWSGFNIEKIYHDIPFIDIVKSDSELYKLFNLTPAEIKIIEETII